MYEELVERLRERAAWINFPHHGEEYPTEDTKLMMDAADAIEELSREVDIDNAAMTAMDAAMPRWIPVTERVPELNQEVLIFAVGKIDGFIGDSAIALSERYVFRLFPTSEGTEMWRAPWEYFLADYEITHWMPLPSTEGLNET